MIGIMGGSLTGPGPVGSEDPGISRVDDPDEVELRELIVSDEDRDPPVKVEVSGSAEPVCMKS